MITRENRVLRRPGRRFLLLPVPGGALESYELKGPHAWPRPEGRPASRVAYVCPLLWHLEGPQSFSIVRVDSASVLVT